MSNTPPPTPWTRGRHGTHEVVTIELTVCRDTHGRVYSSHRLANNEDQEIALSWPSGGQEQVGFALLTEAVRREAVLTLLLLLTQEKETLGSLRSITDERLAEIQAGLRTGLHGTVEALAEGSLRDALATICR